MIDRFDAVPPTLLPDPEGGSFRRYALLHQPPQARVQAAATTAQGTSPSAQRLGKVVLAVEERDPPRNSSGCQMRRSTPSAWLSAAVACSALLISSSPASSFMLQSPPLGSTITMTRSKAGGLAPAVSSSLESRRVGRGSVRIFMAEGEGEKGEEKEDDGWGGGGGSSTSAPTAPAGAPEAPTIGANPKIRQDVPQLVTQELGITDVIEAVGDEPKQRRINGVLIIGGGVPIMDRTGWEPAELTPEDQIPGKIVVDEETLRKQQKDLEAYAQELRAERMAVDAVNNQLFGFCKQAEVINGRMAMFFIVVGLLTELWTGESFPQQVETLGRVLGLIPLDYDGMF